jgi:hypothetical protein
LLGGSGRRFGTGAKQMAEAKSAGFCLWPPWEMVNSDQTKRRFPEIRPNRSIGADQLKAYGIY